MNKCTMLFHCWANERRGIGVTIVPAEKGVLSGEGEKDFWFGFTALLNRRESRQFEYQ